jgi:hypothetical protein
MKAFEMAKQIIAQVKSISQTRQPPIGEVEDAPQWRLGEKQRHRW